MRVVIASVLAVIAAAATTPLAAGAAATGTITGHVRLTGPIPANPIIRMGADPLCARLARASGKRPIQELVVASKDGGLANVFADLQGSFAAVPPPPKDPVVVTQRGCIYSPRMVGARVGQTLRLVNGDTLLHNLHGISAHGNGFNDTQPQSGMVSNFTMKAPEMLRVKCDVHNWMTLYVGVVAHPYFAVTGGDGTFTIANVPAGRQTVRIWHERYGRLSKVIDVKPGAATTVEFTYSGSEKPPADARDVTVPEGALALAL
jgi:plastocyanin